MSNEKNKITIKSYVQVALLILVTVVIVLYLSSWYASYKKDKLSIPVINGTLSEIRYEELDPYLKENNGTLYLYMCTSDEDICRNFEKEFIKIIDKKDLYDKILYLNLTNVDNKNDFLKEFNRKYSKNKKVSAYPIIVKFTNGKVNKIIGNSHGLTINELKKYLDEFEIN